MNSSSPSLAFPQSLAIDFRALGPVVALVALFILGAVINDAFYSAGNLTNILTRSAFIGIIAVGATFVITAGGIDLSVGSMAAFISGCMIVVMNGLITTRGKIEAFIVTLGTMGIYRSLVTYIADGGTLSLDFAVRGVYRPFYYGDILGIPVPVLVFAAVAVLGYLALNKTRFGRHCFAIGSNEHVARYSAVSVERVRTATYIVQGLCVSVATIIYVPRLGSASASTGVLWELEAIAAVIIGGTVVGAIMLTMIGNILNLTDAISNYLNGTVQGIIIIVAVYLQRGSWRQKNGGCPS